ncbi:hypothetical protein C8J57DRAFT_1504934 [Mycena rebaudengoi]|nr:hypothetical protein C8J57DRAFT_1504934 [Mycena rebaudengoi]
MTRHARPLFTAGIGGGGIVSVVRRAPEHRTAITGDTGSQYHYMRASKFSSIPEPVTSTLILASKFTQDKCYSNRAWAQLSGLPAREIGCCDRALGDALDWRL